MHSNLNFEDGKEVAVIRNADPKIKDKMVYLANESETIRNPFDTIETKKGEKVHLNVPTNNRMVLYVVGMSGSGKSYWSTQFVKEYKKKNKDKKVFIISPITDDENINSIKNLERINPHSENYVKQPPPLNYFKDGLIICDDIEAYSKKTLTSVMALINAVLTTGRHHNISLLFLAHTATNGAMSKIILNEAHGLVIFPANMSGKSSKYLLDTYYGLNKHQIEKVKKMPSRTVIIFRSYPTLIISENQITPLPNF